MDKRAIIQAAFGKIGLGPYAYDMQPEDFASALLDLDAMMALWDSNGVKVGYPLGGDINTDANLPADAVQAVVNGLAVQVAPGYGKTVAPATMMAAREGYVMLVRKSAFIPRLAMDTGSVPGGAGRMMRDNQFLPSEVPK